MREKEVCDCEFVSERIEVCDCVQCVEWDNGDAVLWVFGQNIGVFAFRILFLLYFVLRRL